ncbi:MAG: phytoene desaturase [Crocinitomicaceae bacterium]|nr:phytoene desaturase [Crocinitomicaceae bacterium]MBK8925056.1 phytoene desaturase [Crocinitomicaceae bacterium]
MTNSKQKIAVIGAGLAGLAVAIRLRHQGFHVIVFEKQATHGGKLAEFTQHGYRFDKGPSLFTEPWELEELFSAVKEESSKFFSFKKIETACHYFFPDRTILRFSGNQKELKDEIETKISSEAALNVLSYLADSKKTYERIGTFFISQKAFTLRDIFKKELLVRYPWFLSSRMTKSLHAFNHGRLKNDKLVKIFDRFGTYNGSNPFQMSGIYSTIPHLEHNTGTWFPDRGMRDIVDSVYKLAVKNGVEFRFNQKIQDINFKDNSYTIVSDQSEKYNAVVCAIDHLAFYRDLLKDKALFKKYEEQERSSSGLVFYWGIKKQFKQLHLHNIMFSEDYKKEFEQIFCDKKIPDDPTVYVHISSVVNESDAPRGCQNWFVMINTPAGIFPNESEILAIKNRIFHKLTIHLGEDIAPYVETESYWTAKNLEIETGAFQGALYGASSNHKLAAIKRHKNTIKKYPRLYFCGGTVHPGGGIPLVLRSARIVSEIIQQDASI